MTVRRAAGSEDYFLELLASAVNQRETLLRKPNVSWEWIYKMADYHHVSNLIYYKIMWVDAKDAQKWKEKFSERYQLAIKLNTQYEKLEEELEKRFQEGHINVLFLGNGLYKPYYPYPEMRMPQSVKILVEKGKTVEAGKILRESGLQFQKKKEEKDRNQSYCLHDMRVEVMEELPFTDRLVRRWFRNFLSKVPRVQGKKYIHYMTMEILYLYLITDISRKYAEGEAELRDALDLWVLLKACGQDMIWKWIGKELESLGLEVFSEYFLYLIGGWFGKMQFSEESDVLHDMQTYFLSKGQKARAENEKFFPIIKNVADTYYRNLRKEEKKRDRQMKYPSVEYMRTAFPVLDMFPWLLPVFWIVRMVKRKEYVRKENTRNQKEEKEDD